MTDKQITIDGVDVSECEFCDWKGSNIPQCRIRLASFETTCKGYNCYYKQLKHKEQECEKLKEDEKSLLNVIDHLQKTKNEWEEKYNDLGQDFDQLKAENEKLKSEIKHYKQIAQYHGNLSVKYTNKSAKLKQTLAEIKVICNNNDELQGDFNVVDCDKYKLGKHSLANKVLQKISEVENEN